MVRDAKLDPVKYATLFQQHPVVGTNEFCSRDMLEIVDSPPPLRNLRVIEASDFALGENSTKGDFTAHVAVGVDPESNFWVLDVWRDRQPTLQAVDAMLDQAEKYKPVAMLADDDVLVRSMRQFIYDRMRERGKSWFMKFLPTRGRDKRARAAPLEGLLHLRRVKLVRGSWNEDVLKELTEFPVGRHDDVVDCLSLIARHVIEIGKGKADPAPAQDPFRHQPIIERDGRPYLNRSLDEMWKDREQERRNQRPIRM
jgi:predicted phage terminase large subunit-like protein